VHSPPERDLKAAQQHQQDGRPDDAEAIYRALLLANPKDSAALHAWGLLRRAARDLPGAARLLNAAVTHGAGVAASVDLAALYLEQGDLIPAERLLVEAARTAPAMASISFNLGLLRHMQGRLDEAIERYREAVRREPGYVKARFNHAALLDQTGRFEEAIAALTALLRRWPSHTDALVMLGTIRGKQKRFPEALACYDTAEAAGADLSTVISQVALGFAHICDWSRRDALQTRITRALESDSPLIIDPFILLSQRDEPAEHLRVSARFGAAVTRHAAPLARPKIHTRPHHGRRIRLGYLSADLHQHATSVLMAEIFELHDRERFEVFAYSFGIDDASPMRRRLVAGFDRFIGLGLEPPAASAQRIAGDEVDVLIDLKGYTDSARPEIFALRPAPIQVSHLGYPGTLGVPWMDYVIADPVVLPFADQPYWSERIVHLPHCYQPNDRQRPVAEVDTSRAAHGLPEDGFVFVCFNSPYKLTPDRFQLWMELLAAVPNSVLWLLANNDQVAPNLQREAAARGIDPQRLIFAGTCNHALHLARYGLADLFLDTTPYGAHTTASDALWMGVPVLSCAGRSFASRVGASLLHAVGLPELATQSDAEYKALALQLARDPDKLGKLRARLQENRLTTPLFDSTAFTRALESAYETMMEIYARGAPPAAFAVQPATLVPA
jgi:predicted O-linked N-acetylglucosamine transferase (SPINDLY family)